MLTKAKEILAKCESDLRSLLTQAASTGDYDAVAQIAQWAREVGAINGPSPAIKRLPPTEKEAKAAAPAKPKAKGRGKAKDYPKFMRRSANLVKIGWSKRERDEYEHKAPRSAANPLAKALAKVGAGGKVFQIPELLPLMDQEHQEQVPDYQVYLIFAWFRTIGLVDQHGRQGYSIPKPDTLEADLDTAWAALPTKR